MAVKEKIRIRLKSYDASLIDSAAEKIVETARSYDPAKLTKYAVEAATLFHKFYDKCRIRGEAEPLMQARLNLCLAVRTVLRNVLTILKITVPESM